MAEITAALVKELREKSGAGMMDCKKALIENNGDVEAAIDWLRTKGMMAAAKKSGRAATEGLVGVVTSGTSGAMLEVNAETDFVARNDQFRAYVRTATEIALGNDGDLEAVRKSGFPGESRTVEEQLTNLIATIGENMSLRRSLSLSVDQGVVASYVHNTIEDGLGKIGVLVALKSTAPAEKLVETARKIAMHVAATNPQSLTEADLDPALVAREREVLVEQARESGKPDNIIEKMIEGRIRKYYEEVCLVKQIYVIDGESRIEQVVEKLAKDLGTPVELVAFARFGLGEGLEKKEDDFAAEVAAMSGTN
ncbi:translation elongation factor Ts [Govanella unica]|uniref:Elongation factor Ts n=1 Tax=Govanella unica TaxID=2975056 RepID=A0A9X3TY08_9PROT|nr:translation elongation factor Ts [Govania unica]MDA5193767.1 translation elongation factor Ts [Govania unica]